MNLGVNTLTAAWPHPAESQLETGQLGQRIVIRGAAAVNGSVVPITPEQRQTRTLAGDFAQ